MRFKRLTQRILKEMNRANRDFSLVKAEDRILVAVSGGKDSYALLWCLLELQKNAPYPFSLVAFHLDQGQPGHDPRALAEHFQSLNIDYEIERQDTYTRVIEKVEPGKIYCSLCSRFRRAILYKAANRHNCNKVALGHHKDDLIETLLLNIFFSGQIKSMPARLLSDNGQQEIIRPLCYVPESELSELAEILKFPILPCNLCGSQEAQRKFIKKLLNDLGLKIPHLKGNILHALSNVTPTHLLDKKLNPLFSHD